MNAAMLVRMTPQWQKQASGDSAEQQEAIVPRQ